MYDNGETPKQLLARSRYLLFKSESKWSENQKERADVLFDQFPDIKQAYNLAHKLSWYMKIQVTKPMPCLVKKTGVWLFWRENTLTEVIFVANKTDKFTQWTKADYLALH